jgi:hypothetical protein
VGGPCGPVVVVLRTVVVVVAGVVVVVVAGPVVVVDAWANAGVASATAITVAASSETAALVADNGWERAMYSGYRLTGALPVVRIGLGPRLAAPSTPGA